MKGIVLAYSGGLDTSVILKWLTKNYDSPVYAFIANVGQNDDFDAIKERALKIGAAEVITADITDEFVTDFVFTAIKANAVYEGYYLLGTSLARPVIAKHLAHAAKDLNAEAIAHGATGKGNDQVRFEFAVKYLAPELKIIAPWREWDFESRTDLFNYAKEHGIELPITPKKPYSMDENIAHISYEGGILEDPYSEPPSDMFRWTASPEGAPDKPEYIEISFKKGVPTAINGKIMAPVRLMKELNKIGSKHGVGRVDIVENRYIGIKSRGVYESPGVTILIHAHRAVESITLDREVHHLKESLGIKLSEIIYNGYWFSPEGEQLIKFINNTQENVTGTTRLKLYKGNCTIAGRKSPLSLYNKEAASFESGSENKTYATGFINLNAQRLTAASKQATNFKKRSQGAEKEG